MFCCSLGIVWKRLMTRTDDRLKIISVKQMNFESFWREIGRHLIRLDRAERHDIAIS
jgi:hypothetical protein